MKAQTIVVGYDGSEHARRALETAAGLAPENALVHVVVAYDPPSAMEMERLLAILPGEFRTSFDPLAGPKELVEEAKEVLAARGIDHVEHLVDGGAATAILDVADDVDADLIVVGSRGMGRGTRFLRGSVSSRVADHARRSFLVVHDDDLDLPATD